MGATLDRSAAIGQQAITISGPAARRGGPGAGRCAGGMGTQATHAHLHGIECVERLGLNPLMRALVWLLEWLPAKTAEWLNMVPGRQNCILRGVCGQDLWDPTLVFSERAPSRAPTAPVRDL